MDTTIWPSLVKIGLDLTKDKKVLLIGENFCAVSLMEFSCNLVSSKALACSKGQACSKVQAYSKLQACNNDS